MTEAEHSPGVASERLTDEVFQEQLAAWLDDFHDQVGTDETAKRRRLPGYLHQEEQYADIVRFILHQVPERPRDVLDIGSSTGGLSVAFGLAGMVVEGIEPSNAGVIASVTRAARRGLVGQVGFRVGYGEHLPYADVSFDLVVSIAVLEHVRDVDQVIKETFRVLRPGGYAYFEVPNNLCPFEGHYKLPWLPMMPKPLASFWVRLHGRDPRFLDHLHYMSRGIASRAFAKVGFVAVRDVWGSYLIDRLLGGQWTRRPGRLSTHQWLRPLLAATYLHAPIALFTTRAVGLIARKPCIGESAVGSSNRPPAIGMR